MRERILDQLGAIEREKGIRVLYSCESGSRAWGFSSRDSDYDARFIYVLPRDRYLAIGDPADTIDCGVDEDRIDLTGWELRKALRLFQKSNASLFEWLRSPIVYREEIVVISEWRSLMAMYFSPRAAAGHYVGLARKFWIGHLQQEDVTAKQYLYCLRALFAAQWIDEKKTPIPVPFDELRRGVAVENRIGEVIDDMIAGKSRQDEKDRISRHGLLHEYIEATLPEVDARVASLPDAQNEAAPLDRFFRSIVEAQS